MRTAPRIGDKWIERERLSDLHELQAGLPIDGIWAMVAILEHAPRKWLTTLMDEGEQSVGVSVRLEQVVPRPDGDEVVTTATLREMRGRRYVFEVVVQNAAGD